MALDNYRDLSTSGNDINAGFQFEFACNVCQRKWKSPFKPYRFGQITGLLTRFSFLVSDFKTAGRTSGNLADMGTRGAKGKALAEARAQAERLYTECPKCHQGVCEDCYVQDKNACTACLDKAAGDARVAARQAEYETHERTSVASCPNCRTAHAGGRFCAECGFDMASTHKSCPACSATLPRQARFCTDCGHGF